MIVVPDPLCGEVSHLIQIVPVILTEPFISDSPVKPFNVGVLLGLAWLNVLKLNTHFLGPLLHQAVDFPF